MMNSNFILLSKLPKILMFESLFC